MKFQDYKVGLVCSPAGLSDSQLAVIVKKLAEIADFIEERGRISLIVPAFSINGIEERVPAEVRNLSMRFKVEMNYLGLNEWENGHAQAIRYHLENEAISRGQCCDEIWCCPAPGQTGASKARVAQVYALGQQGRIPRIYKLIPAWVSMPSAPQVKEKPKRSPGMAQPEGPRKAWDAPQRPAVSPGRAKKKAKLKVAKEKRRSDDFAMWLAENKLNY